MEPDIVEVVSRARAGDKEAVDFVAHRALTLALRTSAATIGSREEAADVAQEVAIDVLRGLRSLRDPSHFDTWVYRITARRALRFLELRRGRSRAESHLDALGENEQPSIEIGEAALAERWSVTPAIRDALAELPPRQRLALALRYVADLTDSEIADVLGCRRGTACSLLSRGRSALQANPLLADLRPSHLQGDC
jgi:RNA polymerase sigma-70 factor (ECF subfamily)